MEQENKFDFGFDETSKSHLKNIALWAGINAILSLAGLALAIVGFFMLGNSVMYRENTQITFGFSSDNGLVLFIQSIFSILLNVILYSSSKQIKDGLNSLNNSQLTYGLRTLRTYYKTYGIILIVLVILSLLGILFVMSFRRY